MYVLEIILGFLKDTMAMLYALISLIYILVVPLHRVRPKDIKLFSQKHILKYIDICHEIQSEQLTAIMNFVDNYFQS